MVSFNIEILRSIVVAVVINLKLPSWIVWRASEVDCHEVTEGDL